MRLTVLSPIHIGDGSELTAVDIYPSHEKIFVLDTARLTNDLLSLGVSIEEILSLLKNPPGDYYVFKGYIDEFKLRVEDYTLYSLPIIGKEGKESMRIKRFIRTDGKPYIPGSSIKGAIRTAVLYKVLKECGDSGTAMEVIRNMAGKAGGKKRENVEHLINAIGRNTTLLEYYIHYLDSQLRRSEERKGRFDPKSADDLLEAIVFGMEPTWNFPGIGYEPKRDPMRALVVRDSGPIGKKHLAVYRVEVVGAENPIPIWVEGLTPEASTEVEIRFDRETLRRNRDYFNGLLWECLSNYGRPEEVFEDFLWEAVEEFYGRVIEEEMRNSSKFGAYKRSVEDFYRTLPDGKRLRLGWGSGWISTTIGLLLKGERRWEEIRKRLRLGMKPGGGSVSANFPKTRRIADGMPMGWVTLQ
ncbi:type III-A CRISPR-associated RAMP protein Csm5 [Thermococcus bergensis]|uniref:type III-A CRISPR-associated RAMP protein Csm5 n=1 Tax=Thermococcus bergensis TaxID=2689387 RepID=UPI001CEC8550|nr:type III-A CRISPR-associated RAMP protein Csm5 [Thermococcus bergensis]MCA6213804.1 type III-A CRISPR-associated RAMP protein Csm5 [Thermococcus bergensis]